MFDYFNPAPQGELSPICSGCWRARNPAKWPFAPWRYTTTEEICHFCGNTTYSSLTAYARRNNG